MNFVRRLSHGLIKALKKFQVRVAGCQKFLPLRKEKINFAPGKYFCRVSGLRYFFIVYTRAACIMQYYFFQLMINKAQTPLGPRQSNFCHSDNYLLFFSSLTFLRDQPQPGFFLDARDRTLGKRLVVL